MKTQCLAFFCLLITSITIAQTTVSGIVYDEFLEPFPGAIIKSSEGKSTTADFDGFFSMKVKKFPVTIKVNSVGKQEEIINLTKQPKRLNVVLKDAQAFDQVVLSASRTPERVIESPVTIERIDAKYIKNTASFNFYESLGNLKGVDVLSNSYGVKSIVTNRGFGGTSNVRFVQLVDGAESITPTTDFSLGNSFGLSELDVNTVEILPGAASALYGANAFNGILLMTSKNPFYYTGISTLFKTGFTAQNGRDNYAFYDTEVRLAHKFNDIIAAKVNFSHRTGEEWAANDLRSVKTENGRTVIANEINNGAVDYDPLNSYGEVGGDLSLLAGALNLDNPQQYAGINLVRTGYTESEILGDDSKSKIIGFDGAIHIKPWKDDNEIILASKFSLVDNIIHDASRYKQKGTYQEHFRAELKGEDYFVRGYYTSNEAGEIWDMSSAATGVVRGWKDRLTYLTQAAGVFSQGIAENPSLLSDRDALSQALVGYRDIVEIGKPVAGSPEFNRLLQAAKNKTIQEGGAKITGNASIIHADANWNLKDEIKFVDILVGGNYRQYTLDSNGDVYTDDDGPITYDNYGVYTQLRKILLDERLKLTATLRYDDSQNFSGNFSPRFTVSYAAGKKKQHNFRFAYQTGFRNPTNQDQYAGLAVGDNVIVLGTIEENLTRETVTIDGQSFTGVNAMDRGYTSESIGAFLETRDTSVLERGIVNNVMPETVRSFELGYRAAFGIGTNLVEFDMVGFYNFHDDFITSKAVFLPYVDGKIDPNGGDALSNIDPTSLAGQIISEQFLIFSLRTNTTSKIDAYGFTAGFNTDLSGFDLGLNYAFSDYKSDGTDLSFNPEFNVPKHSVKMQFGRESLFKNFGFNTNLRWQDAFEYKSAFVDDYINARFVLDGQLNYRIPSIKSIFKIGGTNLTGNNYISVPGAGILGSQYYISWIVNN